jgi:hypothetical protein
MTEDVHILREAALEAELIETRAILEAIRDAFEGRPVNEFMLSFPVVRSAYELAMPTWWWCDECERFLHSRHSHSQLPRP